MIFHEHAFVQVRLFSVYVSIWVHFIFESLNIHFEGQQGFSTFDVPCLAWMAGMCEFVLLAEVACFSSHDARCLHTLQFSNKYIHAMGQICVYYHV